MALKIVTTNTISYSAIGIGISHDIIQFVFLKLVLQDVFLRDIWPTRDEIQAVEKKYVIPAMFKVG